MAVKIIIKRRVQPDKETDLLPLLNKLRSSAMAESGYISGETMRSAEDPEEYLVISTWKSLNSWKTWESSTQRKEIQKEIDTLLKEETESSVYFYGE